MHKTKTNVVFVCFYIWNWIPERWSCWCLLTCLSYVLHLTTWQSLQETECQTVTGNRNKQHADRNARERHNDSNILKCKTEFQVTITMTQHLAALYSFYNKRSNNVQRAFRVVSDFTLEENLVYLITTKENDNISFIAVGTVWSDWHKYLYGLFWCSFYMHLYVYIDFKCGNVTGCHLR